MRVPAKRTSTSNTSNSFFNAKSIASSPLAQSFKIVNLPSSFRPVMSDFLSYIPEWVRGFLFVSINRI
ncbi:hypothetical protein LEP1GSC188_0642 [Leptospira weilii serovar Topaz str. LT2116]|uniref:Uncharacterized protein n=1 Tax=Leptospira weilii serovar Topaz str. LT2116 TaxID=1088540 RepID=M3EN97_9LEPT|nr:hypothetical protein LEP1GSC188_0642 [Leptospira weilii serovar Topaz str. LT2116]